MKNLKKALEQKKFEAICREFNDLVNAAQLPKEISVSCNFDHYPECKVIDLHFYKWEVDKYNRRGDIIDSIWISAATNLAYFDYKINAMRNALIACKKGDFVWPEQAAIEKQIR